jgi:hypothetical protein
MTNDKITITDATTGETIEREMTDEEQFERDQFLVKAEAERKAVETAAKKAKTAAETKLNALGLTIDDLKALGL